MSTQLGYSMFQDVLFPSDTGASAQDGDQQFQLRRLKRYVPEPTASLEDIDLVVFDLETTGLDYERDRIIEIGAIRLRGFQEVDRFSTLVHTDEELTEDIIRLTGITPDMLAGQPRIEPVLDDFLKFIDGAILVAHNADFDLPMVRAAYSRVGIDLEWATFCTLKMARVVLAELENKKLDTIAEHYGLTFESRHRSIGDVKVTCGVLQGMLTGEASHLHTWADMSDYTVN